MLERLDGGETVAAEQLLAAADLTAAATDSKPHVFFNFVATLDGRAAIDGSSRRLGGPADLELLLALRVAADAVLVGPGTLRAEGYGRLLSPDRRAAPPPAVVISRSFDLPWDAGLFAASDQPVIVYTATAGELPAVAAPVEVVRLAQCTPAAVLADLRGREIRSLLSEGGPTLFGGFAAAGLVDELFLTVSPLLAGDESQTAILAHSRLADPARFTLTSVARDEHELYLRYAWVR